MTHTRAIHALMCGLLAVAVTLAGRAYAVDGVIEINQARASKGGVTPGDMPGLPVTISTGTFASEPMSFRLTGPLQTSTTGNVIEITSPHVTLDLNGFSILCLLPSCSGTGVLSAQANISVINGTVRGFSTAGVSLIGAGAHVENVRVTGSGLGIRTASFCNVRDNVANDNTDDGIVVGLGCVVAGNTSTNNDGDGIQASSSSNVTGNTVRSNTGFGLNLATGTGYSHNVMSDNTAGTVDSGVNAGGNVCNSSTTCP